MEFKEEYGPLLQDIVRSLPATLFFKNAESRYVFTTKVCDLVQAGPEGTIIGKFDYDIQRDESLGRRYYEEDQEILKTGISTHTIDPIPIEGGTVYIEVLKEPIRNDEGKIIGICGICNDVTELENLKRRYEELSLFDSMTDLYNRNYAIEHDFDRQECLPCSYIFCDCNNLKVVNDQLGHDVGDRYIMTAAKVLKKCAQTQSVAIRWGGDEFLIITPNCSETVHDEMMQNIRASQRELASIHPMASLSIGAILRTSLDLPEPEAMKSADEQMYRDKAKTKQAR